MNIFKCIIFSFFLLLFSTRLFSQTKTDGWEEGSRYNKHFTTSRVDTVTGKVLKVEEISPMPGMASGMELLVLSGKDSVLVQVCPKWMADNLHLSIKVNDDVEVEGCKAVCNGKKVFMASRLTAPGIILNLRDEKGSPIWDRLR